MQSLLSPTVLDHLHLILISVSCSYNSLHECIHVIDQFILGTYDVQGTTYNVPDEPVTVTIDYIENTEALGALLALMYLDQDRNIVCDQSIYAAIRRSEDDFPLPMGDPAMTNSYMGLAYDIERDGLEDKAHPAVRRHVDSGG